MSNQPVSSIRTISAGTVDYLTALKLQETTHHEVVAGLATSAIIWVQHPAVLTLGKHADPRFLKLAHSEFKDLGVDVVQTDRGGEVTAHMPGQLVVYPIIRLADFNLTPRIWVELLEQSVISTLDHFGIKAVTDPINPGVWVNSRKICAVGIRIKQRASLHGLALNVSNSLELFDKIVPCGIQNRGVTSMAQCVPKAPTVAEVASVLVVRLTGMLQLRARV